MILTEVLKQFPIFGNFKKQELELILQNSFIKTVSKNEHIFLTNEKRDIFFIVIEGEIAILRKLGQATQIVEIVTKGEYIGEHALFSPHDLHSHTAVTYSKKATILGLPGKRFQKLPSQIGYKLILNLLPIISDNFSHASNRIMTVLQIGQILSQNIPTVALLGEAILKILLQAIRAQKALIALRESDPTKVKIRAISGFNQKSIIINQTISLHQDAILKSIIAYGKSLNLMENDNLFKTRQSSYAKNSLLGRPLKVAGNSIGALLLIDKLEARSFNTNNEVLLNIIGEMVALGIYQAQQKEFLEAEQELKREYIGL